MSLFPLLQDLRFALRQLSRAPVFALTAMLTLALGIGANTAIFSLLDQALLRSLPVRDPARLMVLEGTGTMWEGHSSSHGGDREAYFSVPMYRDLRDLNRAFEGLLASAPADIGFSRNGHTEATRAELVSGNYFNVLGVEPALGRLFSAGDDTSPNANPVVVLSFDFWRGQLGADPSVIGSTVSVNGHPFQVLGVAAPRFRSAIWGETPGVFVPMSMTGQILPGQEKRLRDHTDKWINILGRLKADEAIAAAETAMNPLWHNLRAEELKALGTRSKRFTDDFLTNSRMLIKPGARGFSYQRDRFARPLVAIMAMALLVLLVASVNVASLLLVRSAGRVREFSLRYALGATSSRLVAQLLLEGLLIGVGGGLIGLLLAPLAVQALVHQFAGDQTQIAFSSTIDTRVLTFNFLIALAVSVLFSLAPTLQLRRPDLSAVLRQSVGASSGSLLGLRRTVVCVQIGLSVLLLVGAGLFVRTMQNLRAVDLGFSTSHLVTFGINPKLSGYSTLAVPALHQRVIDTLTALPGVQLVGASNLAQLAGDDHGGNVTVAGYIPPADDEFDVEKEAVNPAYFRALGIPLLAGRAFTEADSATGQRIAIVNQAFVKHFCSGSIRACLGRQMMNGASNHPKLDTEIVGVVRNFRHDSVRDDAQATEFQPLPQNEISSNLFLYLRTATLPDQMLPTVRRTMQQLDPSLPLIDLRTMDAQVDDSLTNERMITLLALSFGLLATLLAGIGIYGVLAFTTAQRTREIGIRIALGSPRLIIVRLVVLDVLRLAGISVAVAIPCSLALTHLLQSQLFGISSADALTLGTVVLLITFVALVAALIPARRAASITPTEALRTEG